MNLFFIIGMYMYTKLAHQKPLLENGFGPLSFVQEHININFAPVLI